ncbi:MAG: TadE family protein [Candidatus Angelobacter sp.]|jgi:Flp pilus assembly protein TadG|nr:TadE family protein [Candidatus Angelobacter sp.]
MGETNSIGRGRDSRGQSLVETAVMLPLLLMALLNAVNFGYYFFVTLNLTATARNAATYSIQGPSTPVASVFPFAGPANGTTFGNSTVTYLAQQDMTGALWNPTAASVQVCSQTNLDGSNSGINGTGSSARTNCITCSGTTCGAVTTGSPIPNADPEAPTFVLNRVDVTYVFPPIIPGTPFNIALLAANICSANSCTFIRHIEMRAM